MRHLKTAPKQEPKLWAPRKLSIACGQNKPKGFTGIDLAGDADIVHDLFSVPWPIKTSSVQEAECSHWVEHIPHRLDGHTKDGWFVFFEELHRVMKKNGTAQIVHPYAMNGRAFWDPTHTRYIHETTWYYLDKQWREAQRLDHYDTDVDFEVVVINGVGIPDEVMNRNHEYQTHARMHFWNVVADLHVILKARK